MKDFFKKIKTYLKNRFSKFTIHDYIIAGFSFLIGVIGLYFSIGMSIKIGKGLTLFGDVNYTGDEVEKVGPTASDKNIVTLFWILTTAVLLFTVYYVFFYKIDREKPKQKEVIDFAVEEINEVEEVEDKKPKQVEKKAKKKVNE